MNTSMYLDALKARLNLPSDYAAAKRLGVSQQRISNYRSGRQQMDDDLIPKVAELLEVDPAIVAFDIYAARATSGFARELFGRLAEIARDANSTGPAIAADPQSPALESSGGSSGTRTQDQRIKSPMLYRLS